MCALIAEQLHRSLSIPTHRSGPSVSLLWWATTVLEGSTLQANVKLGVISFERNSGYGFIGWSSNAMVALYGEGRARHMEAWQTLYETLEVMNQVVNEYKDKYKLNYSVLAAPAEGLSDVLPKDRPKVYGIIQRERSRPHINSFHIG